jgi:hypothetical protein
MFRIPVIPIAVLAVSVMAVPAFADTRIEYVDDQDGETQTVIAIKNGNVRIDDADGDGYTLFRSADRILVIVDHNDQTYMEMDEASMDEVSGQVREAMAEMHRQLEQMPPAQREMMERMMGGVKDAGKSMFEMKVDRTGRRMKHAGYDCEQVFVSIGTLARTELCVVESGKLDMPAADRRALDAMQEQMHRFAEKMTQDIGINFTFDFKSMGGIPVYMKEDNDPAAEILNEVSHDRLDASLFEVPKGYRKETVRIDR